MKHLSKAKTAVIKARILRGDKYAEIASDYRINQGRIADLKFGRIRADVEPVDLGHRSPRSRKRQGHQRDDTRPKGEGIRAFDYGEIVQDSRTVYKKVFSSKGYS